MPIKPGEAEKHRYPIGLTKAMGYVGPEFFEPLSEEELGLWEGSCMLPSDPLNPDFDPNWKQEMRLLLDTCSFL